MKLPKRLIPFVFVFLVALPLSGVMSGFGTWRGIGFKANFIEVWLKNWGIGFLVAYPTALIVVPIVRKVMSKIS